MGELMFCFKCCVPPKPPQKKRIDRSMIGLPTNFIHTTHVGRNDADSSNRVEMLQNQMSSKGGYNYTSPANVHLNVIDVRREGDL